MHLISELFHWSDSMSKRQYTKQTEEDAKVTLQGALGGGVGYTHDFRFPSAGMVRIFEFGCEYLPRPFAVVVKMVNNITRTRSIGGKYIAVLKHYRCVVLDQQSYLALIHAVLQSALRFTTRHCACSTGNV